MIERQPCSYAATVWGYSLNIHCFVQIIATYPDNDKLVSEKQFAPVEPNLERLMGEIQMATDFALTKPTDAQTLIRIREIGFLMHNLGSLCYTLRRFGNVDANDIQIIVALKGKAELFRHAFTGAIVGRSRPTRNTPARLNLFTKSTGARYA